MQHYETPRLILRPVELLDAEFLYKLLNSEKWLKYIGDRNVKSIAAAENYIQEKMFPHYENGFYNYVVILKSTKEKIGTCGIFKRTQENPPDIGFAFLEDFEGFGYAFEAAQKIKELGIQNLGLKKISGITLENNASSRKLLEKLGLHFVKNFYTDGDPEELMYYEWSEK